MDVGTIFIIGAIGNLDDKPGITLDSVVAQVNSNKEAREYHVKIKSPGGDVEVGYDIYNYLKSLKKPITTQAIGNVDSIASVIFMAGQSRQMFPGSSMTIHNPWVGLSGSGEASDLRNIADHLQEAEDRMAKTYTEATGNTIEGITPLMRDETTLSPQRAKDLGFATEVVEMAAQPFAYINNKNNKMSDKKETVSLLEDLKAWFKAEYKTSPKALIMRTAEGVDIDFFELEEGAMAVVGAQATVNGEPAEGEYVMASGMVFVFEGGTLTAINEPETEGNSEGEGDFDNAVIKKIEEMFGQKFASMQTEIENVKEENKALKAEVAERTSMFNGLKAIVGKAAGEEKGNDDKPGENSAPTKKTLFGDFLASRNN